MNSSLLTVRQTPHSGLGVFALHRIPASTLLISERPLLTIYKTPSSITPSDISAALSPLPPTLSAQFHALSSPPDTHHKTSPALAIFAANSIAHLGNSSAACLCLAIARVNHSCAPNAEMAWTTPHDGAGARCELFATRDIAEGEEVCFSYLEGAGCMPGSYRRFMLWLNWRFDCGCRACGGKDDDGSTTLDAAAMTTRRTASDARRMRMYTLRSKLENFSVPVISLKQIMRMGIPIAETWKQPGELQGLLAGLWLPPRPTLGVLSAEERVARWKELIDLMREEELVGKELARCYGEVVGLMRGEAEDGSAVGGRGGADVLAEAKVFAENGRAVMRRCRPLDHRDLAEYEDKISKGLTP